MHFVGNLWVICRSFVGDLWVIWGALRSIDNTLLNLANRVNYTHTLSMGGGVNTLTWWRAIAKSINEYLFLLTQ